MRRNLVLNLMQRNLRLWFKLRRLLMGVTNLSRSGGTVSITPNGRSVDNTRQVILVENSDFFIPHLHSTPLSEYFHTVWYGKQEVKVI